MLILFDQSALQELTLWMVNLQTKRQERIVQLFRVKNIILYIYIPQETYMSPIILSMFPICCLHVSIFPYMLRQFSYTVLCVSYVVLYFSYISIFLFFALLCSGIHYLFFRPTTGSHVLNAGRTGPLQNDSCTQKPYKTYVKTYKTYKTA